MRHALLILKVAVTLALLGGVLAAADLTALGRLLAAAAPGYVAAAVAVLIVQTAVLGVRFHLIVKALGRPLTLRSAIELSFVGVFFNQALPSAVGGDAVRAWRLRADGRPWREAVNAVLLDRGSGVLVLAVLAAVAASVDGSGTFAPLRLALWAVVAAGALALALVAAADRWPLVPAAVRRRAAASDLSKGVRTVVATRVAWSLALWSAASHLLAVLAAYWLAAAVGIEPDFVIFATAALCMLLATMIPLSYAGWGIREASAVWLLTRAGVTAETALAISVLFGAAILAASLPGIAFWFAPAEMRRSESPPAASTPSRR